MRDVVDFGLEGFTLLLSKISQFIAVEFFPSLGLRSCHHRRFGKNVTVVRACLRTPEQGSCIHVTATLRWTSKAILRSIENAELVVDLGSDITGGTIVMTSPGVQSCVDRLLFRESH